MYRDLNFLEVSLYQPHLSEEWHILKSFIVKHTQELAKNQNEKQIQSPKKKYKYKYTERQQVRTPLLHLLWNTTLILQHFTGNFLLQSLSICPSKISWLVIITISYQNTRIFHKGKKNKAENQ